MFQFEKRVRRNNAPLRACFFENMGSCKDQRINCICNGHLSRYFGLAVLPFFSVDANNNPEHNYYVVKTGNKALYIPWFSRDSQTLVTDQVVQFAKSVDNPNYITLTDCLVKAFSYDCTTYGVSSNNIDNARFVVRYPDEKLHAIKGNRLPALIKILLSHMQISEVKSSDANGIITRAIPTVIIELNNDQTMLQLKQINPVFIKIYDYLNPPRSGQINVVTPLVIGGFKLLNNKRSKTFIQYTGQGC